MVIISENINVMETGFYGCVRNIVLGGAGAPRLLLERPQEVKACAFGRRPSGSRGGGGGGGGRSMGPATDLQVLPSSKCQFVQNANTTHSSDV